MSGPQLGPRFFLSSMEDNLASLITEVRNRVAELGYELVDLRKRGSRGRPVLQVRVDRSDSAPGGGITHADCSLVSRALELWLDEVRALGEGYVLEVSSPGVERPIRWPEHWSRFRGHEVNIRLTGRGRIRATIVDVINDGTHVLLRPEGTTDDVAVPLEDVRDATLAVNWN